MRETLQNFLTTGTFSLLPFGTRIEQVIELLGSTDSFVPRSNKDSRPSVLKYDRVEFYFNESNELHGTMIQLITEPTEAGRLDFDYSWASERATENEIVSELRNINLSFERQKNFDSTQLTTQTGITFYIDRTLEKIGKFVS